MSWVCWSVAGWLAGVAGLSDTGSAGLEVSWRAVWSEKPTATVGTLGGLRCRQFPFLRGPIVGRLGGCISAVPRFVWKDDACCWTSGRVYEGPECAFAGCAVGIPSGGPRVSEDARNIVPEGADGSANSSDVVGGGGGGMPPK